MKHNPDILIQYNACLVIIGYEQTDFWEMYTPVRKLTNLGYLISPVGQRGWNIFQLDVATSIVNPEVNDNDMYMTLPKRWPEGLNWPMIVVRLKKAVYGFKHAAQLWHNDIHTFLLPHKFTQSQANPILYLHSDGILIGLYVEDISMLCPKDSTKAAIEDKARLSEKCKITNLGTAHQFLSIEIHRKENASCINLGQMAFIIASLKRFNIRNAYDVSTPMNHNVKWNLAEHWGEKKLTDTTGYDPVVGSLIYAALATRPDISFAVSALCQFNSDHFTSYLNAGKRVLQYLKSTAGFWLHFSSSSIDSNDQLTGYTDSGWANDSADRKSPGGIVYLLSNGAVWWQSQKQDLIAMSTLKAKYIACSEGSGEAKWLLQLHRDMHCKDTSPPPINCNIQGRHSHITTWTIKPRTMHIDVCCHTIEDLYACRVVDDSYIHMHKNEADILTKALTKDMHKKFTNATGLW